MFTKHILIDDVIATFKPYSGIAEKISGSMTCGTKPRLFEKGLNMMEVASITGHKDWKMLRRYIHLRAEDLGLKLG